jgi:hypothetical protein
MCWIDRDPGVLCEPAQDLAFAVQQDDLVELDANVAGQLLDLFDELRPGNRLRDDHVMPGAQMGTRRGQRERSSEQPRRVWLVLPPTDQLANPSTSRFSDNGCSWA